MIKFLKRIPWKDVLVTVLVVALGVGAVVGVGTALTAKTKTVSPLVFARGAIDSTGAFVKSDTSIYTEDYIECQGLKIEADFDATGTYQVFYYDSNKKFAGATDVYDTSTSPVYDKGNTFAFAKYCQIVITPDVITDEDGYVDEDYKIKFYEVAGIANKFTITVNKEQSYSWTDVYVADISMTGKYYNNSLTNISEMGSYVPSEIVEVDGFKDVFVVVRNIDQEDAMGQLCIADADGNFISTINFTPEQLTFSGDVAFCHVTLPATASSFVLNGVYNNNYCIYVK